MKIRIIETGELKDLTLRDANGIDWASDLLGTVGAFAPADDSDPEDHYRLTQSDFDWWENQIAEIEQADALIAEFAEKYGSDEREFLVTRLIIAPETEEGYLAHVKSVIESYNE